MTRIGKIGRNVFGAAVLCALGLGANEAVATPGTGGTQRESCNVVQCTYDCQEQGYDRGRCIDYWTCECYNP